MLLGGSTLAAGASLSALISDVCLDSENGILFFVIMPMVAVGCGVAYFMLRREGSRTASHLAEETLQDLPDPEKTVDTGVASEPE